MILFTPVEIFAYEKKIRIVIDIAESCVCVFKYFLVCFCNLQSLFHTFFELFFIIFTLFDKSVYGLKHFSAEASGFAEIYWRFLSEQKQNKWTPWCH